MAVLSLSAGVHYLEILLEVFPGPVLRARPSCLPADPGDRERLISACPGAWSYEVLRREDFKRSDLARLMELGGRLRDQIGRGTSWSGSGSGLACPAISPLSFR